MRIKEDIPKFMRYFNPILKDISEYFIYRWDDSWHGQNIGSKHI